MLAYSGAGGGWCADVVLEVSVFGVEFVPTATFVNQRIPFRKCSMDENVTVKFNPPVKVTNVTDSAYLLQSDEWDAWLPRKHVAPLVVGTEYAELSLPVWLAVKEGLVETEPDPSFPFRNGSTTSGLTRADIMEAATLCGLLMRGYEIRDALWEASKVGLTERNKTDGC